MAAVRLRGSARRSGLRYGRGARFLRDGFRCRDGGLLCDGFRCRSDGRLLRRGFRCRRGDGRLLRDGFRLRSSDGRFLRRRFRSRGDGRLLRRVGATLATLARPRRPDAPNAPYELKRMLRRGTLRIPLRFYAFLLRRRVRILRDAIRVAPGLLILRRRHRPRPAYPARVAILLRVGIRVGLRISGDSLVRLIGPFLAPSPIGRGLG